MQNKPLKMQMNNCFFNLIELKVKFIICVYSFNVLIAIPLRLKAFFIFYCSGSLYMQKNIEFSFELFALAFNCW